MFGQVINAREVTVPARGEAAVQFNHNIVEPGTYTARVDDETATVTVVESADATSAATGTPTTSTQFPGFGPLVALSALLLAALFLARRD
ncbi:PGF-CTERM sorting domain-containing protein [Salinigranum halophilum]|uniref:PGF-CTERM sorting domain-containing protein n=1 Tax=Salinigranum halophilum TaxID=2565931 RepID=UPI0010A87535